MRAVLVLACQGGHFDAQQSDIIQPLPRTGLWADQGKMIIETLFPRASSLGRLLQPPLGSYLEALAQSLQAQHYSRDVIRGYVHAAHRFGEWLSTQGLALSAVSEQLVDRYIHQFEKRISPAHPYAQRPKLTRGLEAAVPMPRQWALASLPTHLDKDHVSQVLAACRKTPPNERRNTAVV
jgi:site-specific recombinase XerD